MALPVSLVSIFTTVTLFPLWPRVYMAGPVGLAFWYGAGLHCPQFHLLVPPGVGYMQEGDFMLFS